ncbi:MAG: chemotaxis protein CheW [Planctomycetota bacterium]
MDSQTPITTDSPGSVEVGAHVNQYLTFFLTGQEYGVDILRVQEIKGWDTVTAIPNTPEYIKGVINLRGTIVPIIDLRQRFGLAANDYGPTTVVIVVRVESENGQSRVLGTVVDAVSDVYNVADVDLKPPPDFGSDAATGFVKGLATVDEKMVILLDIDRLVASESFQSYF